MLRSSLLCSAGLLAVLSGSAFALADVTLINSLPTEQADVSVSLANSIIGVRDRATVGIDFMASVTFASVCDDTSCQTFKIEDTHTSCTLDSTKYDQHGIGLSSAWEFAFYANGREMGTICAPLSTDVFGAVHTKLYIESETNWGKTTHTATFTAGFFEEDTSVTYRW